MKRNQKIAIICIISWTVSGLIGGLDYLNLIKEQKEGVQREFFIYSIFPLYIDIHIRSNTSWVGAYTIGIRERVSDNGTGYGQHTGFGIYSWCEYTITAPGWLNITVYFPHNVVSHSSITNVGEIARCSGRTPFEFFMLLAVLI
ncbi:MAG: hypothetical protein HWN67_08465 [Candidatus Helarchaeota archaeon]|nr:hypothetical protein [Candidatus Helarchaeota archaeon]